MPSIDDIFGGKTLKSEHLKGLAKPPVVTITDVEIREFDDKKHGKVQKPAISFKGSERVLICNLINANMIAELAGTRDYTQWAGTRIKLVVERVSFGADIVDGIRVKDPDSADPVPKKKAAKPEPQAAADDDDMSDDIPF